MKHKSDLKTSEIDNRRKYKGDTRLIKGSSLNKTKVRLQPVTSCYLVISSLKFSLRYLEVMLYVDTLHMRMILPFKSLNFAYILFLKFPDKEHFGSWYC